MAGYLCTTDELEAVVGKRPAAGHLKSIGRLDAHCVTFLAASPFSVLAAFNPDGTPRTFAAGGVPGAAAAPDSTAVVDVTTSRPVEVADGAPAALLSFVPGYRETLRVNGRLRRQDGCDDRVGVVVEEAFLHCAKAVIRSRLWDDPAARDDGARPAAGVVETTTIDERVQSFLAAAPFAALASVDGAGHADVSPKGDPVGFVRVLDDTTIAIPDRPGNRRTDTMHNLIDRAELGVLAFVPGDPRTLELRGHAHVTGDASLRRELAVSGKDATAAIVVELEYVALREEPALIAAALWDTSRHAAAGTLANASRIWTDHVKLNDDPGLAAKAMRALANERVLAAGLRRDYTENLY